MDLLGPFTINRLTLFLLILSRVSGLMVGSPVYGTLEIPVRVRALLAVAITALIVPTQWHVVVDMPQSTLDLSLVLAGELILGLTLGLGMLILFSGIQLAGHMVSQVGGVALSEVLDPNTEDNAPVVSEMLRVFTLAVFVSIGGHRLVMDGLLTTFEGIPPGAAPWQHSIGEALSLLVTQSFALGIRAAAPAVTAMILATLVLGLLSRSLPQLSIFSLGFGLNAMVMLLGLSLSVGGIAWAFSDQIQPTIETLLESMAPVD